MKKQYNITRLTDELQHSVFFQKPEQASEQPKEQNQSTVALKHQVTKVLSKDSAKEPSNQSSIAPNDQRTKALRKQGEKAPEQQHAQAAKNQSTLALKHFSSYLEPGTYKAWKLIATQREKRDYEVLQEAMEQYLEREQEREADRR